MDRKWIMRVDRETSVALRTELSARAWRALYISGVSSTPRETMLFQLCMESTPFPPKRPLHASSPLAGFGAVGAGVFVKILLI